MEDTNNIDATAVREDYDVNAQTLANLIAYGTPYKPIPNAEKDFSALHTLSVENNATVWTTNAIETQSIDSLISLSVLNNYDTFYVSETDEGYMRMYVDPQEFTVSGNTQVWYRRLSLTAGGILLNHEYISPDNITEFSGLDIDGEPINVERLYYGVEWHTIIYVDGTLELNEAIINTEACSFNYTYEQFKDFNDETITLDYEDHEGFGISFIERIANFGSIQADIKKESRKMTIKLKNNDGHVSRFPLIRTALLNHNQYVLEFKYEEQAMFPIPNSDWAIKLKFKSYQGLLYFLNLYYFNNHPFNAYAANCRYETTFLNAYDRLLEKKLFTATEEQLTIFYYLSYDMLINQHPNDLWHVLGKALRGKVNNHGLNTEDIILLILEAIVYNTRVKTTKEAFLETLLTKKLHNKSYLYVLFDKLNNDRFKQYINFIWQIWGDSIYAKIEAKNPAFKDAGGDIPPLVLPHRSDKTLGFYHNNALINWEADNKTIHVALETGDFTYEYPKGGVPGIRVSPVKILNYVHYHYHPFAPVAIINDENPKFIYGTNANGEYTMLPALVLLAYEESAFWNNIITAGEYAFDIITTFTGFGNIFKFRHLAKLSLLQKLVKIGGYIEVASGTINALLKLTGLRDTKYGQALSEYLFYLELLSLGAELTNAIRAGLKRSATKVVSSESFINDLDDLVAKGELDELDKLRLVDELNTFIERGVKNVGGDINKSFFKNAKIALKEEIPVGNVLGQTENYTCVAGTLRMVLDDLGYIRSENFLARALETTTDGAKVLDIPKALKSDYIDNLEIIARGGGKDNIGINALQNQVKQNKKVIASVATDDFGAHAVVVDKIENGRVFLRDPLPLQQGASYSVALKDFEEVFNEKFISIKIK